MTEKQAERYIENFLIALDNLGITHADEAKPSSPGYIETRWLLRYWKEQGEVLDEIQ